ncbi:hypothetical protein JZ751_018498, partial [Albula glossodonta]
MCNWCMKLTNVIISLEHLSDAAPSIHLRAPRTEETIYSGTCRKQRQKCIKLTGTSKDKLCHYSSGSRIHDMEGCINDSSVRCYRDHKCDSKCKAYALEVESASGQRNSILKETNNK